MNRFLSVLVFIVTVQITCACYITNCPIGGKRSLQENSLRTHQCPRCGINGQCFGPSICCTNMGCRIGNPFDSRQCARENHSLEPCSIKASPCSSVANGRCAPSGVCCNADSCQIDEACTASSNQEGDNSHEERLSQARLLFA